MTDDDTDTDHGPDEFPTDEELPDDLPSIDELSPFILDPDDFDDINEFARAELEASKTEDE